MKSGRSKIRPEFLLRSYLLVSSQLRGGYTSLKSALTSATVAVGLIIRKSKKLAVLYALSSREGCDTGRGAWLKSLELGWRETADPKTFPAALPVPPSRDQTDWKVPPFLFSQAKIEIDRATGFQTEGGNESMASRGA